MAELISPREAYDIASQWGSYISAGDPGAVFYSFPTGDATPQGPDHRAQLIAYTESCLKEAKGADKAELESLLQFFRDMPDSGEEFRATYEPESQRLLDGADDFAKGYFRAAMFTGVELPEGHPDSDHDKAYDLDPAAIVPATLRDMLGECAAFQTANADLLAEAYARDGYGGAEWSAEEQAGHDFWLTRNGHGAGFWDREALKEDGLGDKLSEAARTCGESNLYTGDDGGIYEM
jgi:hypothetical protein